MLTLFFDHCFYRDAQGVTFSAGNYNYAFYARRYLPAFGAVRIVGRVLPAPLARPADRRTEGPGVEVAPLGAWRGPGEFVRRWTTIGRRLDRELERAETVIAVTPGIVGFRATRRLQALRRPFAVEVIGDPWDNFAPRAVRHPLRPLFRRWFAHEQRRQCAAAAAAAYVTREALQRSYPPALGAPTAHYSSIELGPEGFAPGPHRAPSTRPIGLVTVGTLEQMYKAPDVLLRSVAAAVRSGLDLRLEVVGEGKHRPELERLAKELGLGERATFLGQLPAGPAVREALDRADLFVLPSRQEGLPRAAIEAMARGLPCIGSTVGGYPELLEREDLVPPDDVRALADKLGEVLRDRRRLERMAQRNLVRAGDYRAEVLAARRQEFYRAVIERCRGSLARVA